MKRWGWIILPLLFVSIEARAAMVSGRITYTGVDYNETAILGKIQRPVRFAKIVVWDNQTKRVYGKSLTDGDGNFSLDVPATLSSPALIFFAGSSGDSRFPFDIIEDVPSAKTRPRFYYSLTVATLTAQPLDIAIPGENSRPFSVHDAIVRGYEFISSVLPLNQPPKLHVEFVDHIAPNMRAGYLYGLSGLVLNSSFSFTHDAILHEFGHFVFDKVLHVPDYPHKTRAHYLEDVRQYPPLAFSEGFADFFSSAARLFADFEEPLLYKNPCYLAAFRVPGDLSNADWEFNVGVEDPIPPKSGQANELSIARAFWDSIDRPGMNDCIKDEGIADNIPPSGSEALSEQMLYGAVEDMSELPPSRLVFDAWFIAWKNRIKQEFGGDTSPQPYGVIRSFTGTSGASVDGPLKAAGINFYSDGNVPVAVYPTELDRPLEPNERPCIEGVYPDNPSLTCPLDYAELLYMGGAETVWASLLPMRLTISPGTNSQMGSDIFDPATWMENDDDYFVVTWLYRAIYNDGAGWTGDTKNVEMEVAPNPVNALSVSLSDELSGDWGGTPMFGRTALSREVWMRPQAKAPAEQACNDVNQEIQSIINALQNPELDSAQQRILELDLQSAQNRRVQLCTDVCVNWTGNVLIRVARSDDPSSKARINFGDYDLKGTPPDEPCPGSPPLLPKRAGPLPDPFPPYSPPPPEPPPPSLDVPVFLPPCLTCLRNCMSQPGALFATCSQQCTNVAPKDCKTDCEACSCGMEYIDQDQNLTNDCVTQCGGDLNALYGSCGNVP